MIKINKMNSLKLGLASALGILVIAALASASFVFAQMGDNPTNSNSGNYGVSLTCDFSNLETEAYPAKDLGWITSLSIASIPGAIGDFDQFREITEEFDFEALLLREDGPDFSLVVHEGISVDDLLDQLRDQGLVLLSSSGYELLSEDDIAQDIDGWIRLQYESASPASVCLNNLSAEDQRALASALIGQDYFPIVATQLGVSEENVRNALNQFVAELMEEEQNASDFGIDDISQALPDLAADMGVTSAALIGALGEAALVLRESYDAMGEEELIKLMVARVAATGLISSDDADDVSQWIDLLEDGFVDLGGFDFLLDIELDAIGGILD